MINGEVEDGSAYYLPLTYSYLHYYYYYRYLNLNAVQNPRPKPTPHPARPPSMYVFISPVYIAGVGTAQRVESGKLTEKCII
jgi:hypothetical protein